MHTVDGSEGGGQLLRTALSLAVVTDTPFRIEGIRGSRPTPGLRPQHLTAVELVAALCDAEVEGAELGAETLTFEPGRDRTRSLSVQTGTAGSVTLLFDTVLPIAAAEGGAYEVTATGGTDVKWSPTVAYQRHVKLPLLAQAGLAADVTVARTGFYPAGGGEATLRTEPSRLSRVTIEDRGALERVEVFSKAAESLADAEVAERQAEAAESALAADVPVSVRRCHYVDAASPGSAVLLRATYADTVAGFDALGEPGKPAEAVAGDAIEAFRRFHGGRGAVDAHMADQVMVFLALAGGRVAIPRTTDHVRTNRDLLEGFGCDVAIEGTEDRPVLVASPL